MTTQPTPEEVCLAADIVQALSVSMDMPHPDVHWRPSELRAEAERIEQAAREEAERADMVELLAAEMFVAVQCCREHQTPWDSAGEAIKDASRASAAQLVEAGWHKGDPA
ncbi:hypothetical protein A5656_28345 [Mycobacterium gordonae]|nr:hypothetical protein [Mycobacterium gordonae]OBK49398.1 hypothetical protein A5656_28345 [Mycobacterium gordonae]